MKFDRQTIGILIIFFALYRMNGGGGLVSNAPFKTDKLSVLIVEETEDRDDTPRSQNAAISSTIWRDYVNSKGGELRVLPPTHDASKESQWVQDALKVERDSLPWLVVSNGKSGFSGTLPENLDGLMTELKKVGGE